MNQTLLSCPMSGLQHISFGQALLPILNQSQKCVSKAMLRAISGNDFIKSHVHKIRNLVSQKFLVKFVYAVVSCVSLILLVMSQPSSPAHKLFYVLLMLASEETTGMYTSESLA